MPIVDIGPTKQLEFGSGDIDISPGLLQTDGVVGVICFNQSAANEIGVKVEYDQPKIMPIEETPVRMIFKKTESIDVMIWALEQTKRRMLVKSLR